MRAAKCGFYLFRGVLDFSERTVTPLPSPLEVVGLGPVSGQILLRFTNLRLFCVRIKALVICATEYKRGLLY